jgi:hypothetical protein
VVGTSVFCCLAILSITLSFFFQGEMFMMLMFDKLFTNKQRTAFFSGFDL